MLVDAEMSDFHHIVSWMPHGKAFRVHKTHEFAKTIMPRYFKQTQYKSFQRQLHIYGFHRITQGVDKGAYYHDMFIRGNKNISLRMIRRKIKGPLAALEAEMREEPDFYKEMKETVTAVPSSIQQEQTESATSTTTPTPIACLSSQISTISRVESQIKEPTLSLTQNLMVSFDTLPETLIEGDEVDFAGKKFHFVQSSGRRGSLVGRRTSMIGRRRSLLFAGYVGKAA